jgi:hypothetical protein
MSQPIDYTMRYQIRSGRVNFADFVKRRQLIQDGVLIGQHAYPPDNDVSIITLLQEGEVNTTQEELNTYIAEAIESEGANVPSAPTNLVATAGNAQLIISFTAPSNGGSPITNYEYFLVDASGADWTPFSPAVITSPVTLSGLSNGQTIRLQLRAINGKGPGAQSAIVAGTPSTTPSPPTSLSGSPGDKQITVSFTAGSTGGSVLTNYQYSTDNGSTFLAFSPADTTSPVTITKLSSDGTTDLTNGTPYTVRLKAVNANGISVLPSSPITVTPILVTVPPEPTSLSGVGGDQAVYILFTQSGTGGSAITNYEYSTDDGATFIACSPAQTFSPVSIPTLSSNGTTPLTNGVPYTVRLKAVNAIGSSIPSDFTTVTTTTNTLNTTNLLVELDANNSSSYSGSGTAWTNLRSSGSYSATLQNSPAFDGTNKYFTFDGTNQIAEIAAAAAINPTVGSAFTVQIWARVDTSSPNFGFGDGLISKQFDSPSYDGYSLSLRPDTSLYLKMNGQSVDGTYSSTTGVYSNGWALYTIVVRFGGGSGSPSYTYVSTRRVVTGNNSESGIPSQAPIQFPRGIQGSTFNFCPADVGAFYLYDTAVSQEDIIRNYDATKTRYGL